jgi:site-specific DNA-methyltransferase (adenine-specific)
MGINIGEGFQVIYADCPWEYDNPQDFDPARGGTPYKQMKMADLCQMCDLVNQVASKDSILFMWATFPKLIEALQVMGAWDYRYVTVAFDWIKLNPNGELYSPMENMATFNTPGKNDGIRITPKDIILKGGVRSGQGYYTNANAEICLLGTKGKTGELRANRSVKQVVFCDDVANRIGDEGECIMTPIKEHSAKPEEVRERINALTGGVPALELFARPPARVPGWVKLGWEIDNKDIREVMQDLIDGNYRRPKDA